MTAIDFGAHFVPRNAGQFGIGDEWLFGVEG